MTPNAVSEQADTLPTDVETAALTSLFEAVLAAPLTASELRLAAQLASALERPDRPQEEA